MQNQKKEHSSPPPNCTTPKKKKTDKENLGDGDGTKNTACSQQDIKVYLLLMS